jgi:hypothetical protein
MSSPTGLVYGWPSKGDQMDLDRRSLLVGGIAAAGMAGLPDLFRLIEPDLHPASQFDLHPFTRSLIDSVTGSA